MVSQIKVNEIIKQSGSSISIGESGDTINIGTTGDTINLAGSAYAEAGTNSGYFMAYRSGGNESPSANTWTPYIYDTTHVNDGTAYSTSTGEYTAASAGRYYFESQFWASQIDDGEVAQIQHYFDLSSAGSFSLNTARSRNSFGFGTGTDKGFAPTVSTLVDLAAGDKIKTYIYVASGGIFANAGYNYFLGFKLV